MIDSNVEDFLKEELIKKLEKEEKELKKSRESKLIANDEIKNLIKKFILNAAENAKNISYATHPCQFSHPSANSDKKFKVTPVCFLRSGTVKSCFKFDMYGSASYNPIMAFLSLSMCNGKSVLENIKDNTNEGRELLSEIEKNIDELRNQFLGITKKIDADCVTSSQIKQVYFPISNG